MWWPCFHHILELVLGAFIQKRWPTEGPRDGVYTRFKKEWRGIFEKMDDISSAGEKVEFVMFLSVREIPQNNRSLKNYLV